MHLVKVFLWPYWLHMGEMEKRFQGMVYVKNNYCGIVICFKLMCQWYSIKFNILLWFLRIDGIKKYCVLISFLCDSRSIAMKLGPERMSKIKIVGNVEVEESFYGQLVLGKGVTSGLDEQLVREAQKAGEYD
jgi:hypothetical protein